MTDALPQIRVRSDTQTQEAGSRGDAHILHDDLLNANKSRFKSQEHMEARPTSNGRTHTTKFKPSLSGIQSNSPSRPVGTDDRRDSQAIDPLSQHILTRTNTPNTVPARIRTSAAGEEGSVSETVASVGVGRPSLDATANRSDSGLKDKRNRASFFSRFAPKKRDVIPEANDDISEVGDRRAEGLDVDVFSQPVGYVPQFPSPPKYIKVRSRGRKEKDFNRLFFAQELRGRTGVEIAQAGGRLVKNSFPKNGDKDGNAIWAMEFSKDGRHLAAGGKDYMVRVWAIISTKEERLAHEAEEEDAGKDARRLSAPVFRTRPIQEYEGHTASILDLSWSKNNFLLSSSMDKTVRLWHLSRKECLCCFKHSDIVTSVQFHPTDDRFFLAGSLDSKVRLWSIPEKSVAYWNQVPDLVTAVTFAPDGKTAVAGCLNGLCLFYDTDGLKYQTQIHVRSAHGKNAKGSKVTGLQAILDPPGDPSAEIKLLVTSNDSRVRVYNLRDKGLQLKLKGNENACSQIHASFSDDARYIICGSEDRKVYVWPTAQTELDKERRQLEVFEAHSAIVTSALLAPTKTRQLLSASGDPLYDLCNPPPVTLTSRTQSQTSSIPLADDSRQQDADRPSTPALSEFQRPSKPEESPAYLARCAHPDGNIIVTADFLGHIKVFRQDCAFRNRIRNNESALSKSMLGRTSSIARKHSNRSQRDFPQLGHPSSERILSWRQSVSSNNGSFDNFRFPQRSSSPRKSSTQATFPSTQRYPSSASLAGSPSLTIATSQQISPHPSFDEPKSANIEVNQRIASSGKKEHGPNPKLDPQKDPLMLQGDQSYMFWNQSTYEAQAAGSNPPQSHLHGSNGYTSTAGSSAASVNSGGHLGPLRREVTNVSRLSSEESSVNEEGVVKNGRGEGGGGSRKHREVVCRRCGGKGFNVKIRDGRETQVLECVDCGEAVSQRGKYRKSR